MSCSEQVVVESEEQVAAYSGAHSAGRSRAEAAARHNKPAQQDFITLRVPRAYSVLTWPWLSKLAEAQAHSASRLGMPATACLAMYLCGCVRGCVAFTHTHTDLNTRTHIPSHTPADPLPL